MTELFRSYSRYTEDRIGEEHEVLICEMATDGVHYVGHNKSYEHILVPDVGRNLLGQRARVRITDVSKFYMKSVVLSANARTTAKTAAPLQSIAKKVYQVLKVPVLFDNSYALRIVVLSQLALVVYFGVKMLLS